MIALTYGSNVMGSRPGGRGQSQIYSRLLFALVMTTALVVQENTIRQVEVKGPKFED